MERAFLSITGSKAGARLIATDLIITERRQVVYLSGFAPAQEARSFGHLLNLGEARLEAVSAEGDRIFSQPNCSSAYNVRVQQAMGNHMVLTVVPEDAAYIVGRLEDECREIFGRILSQKHFAHPQWYSALFDKMPRIEPRIGGLLCYANTLNIEKAVAEGLQTGAFTFPEPTASLELELERKDENEAA